VLSLSERFALADDRFVIPDLPHHLERHSTRIMAFDRNESKTATAVVTCLVGSRLGQRSGTSPDLARRCSRVLGRLSPSTINR
jgi:hypothetical protein